MVELGHGFWAAIPPGYVVNAITGTNWEGVGVEPDVDVTAEQALPKAWSLAVNRLQASTVHPQTRAWLTAFSLAKLSGEPSLDSGQLAGRYVPNGGGFPVVISHREGQLYQQRVEAGVVRDVPLIPCGGDRYRPDGSPHGSCLTFALRDAEVVLLQWGPLFPLVLEKQ